MTDRKGPRARLLAWSADRSPPLHRFLAAEKGPLKALRSGLTIVVVLLLGVALLWGITGQPLGAPPIVVIESGSMMHCDGGTGNPTSRCELSDWAGVTTIDPGDLIFVKNPRGGIETFAEGGRDRYSSPGDVLIYDRGPAVPPIIHRAMFSFTSHGNGTFSIPELGLDHETDLDHEAIRDRDRFGISPTCQLFTGHTRAAILDTEWFGYVTKGDNSATNPCWDQGGGIWETPVRPEQIVGKARGELPWIGLLKLWVFDILQGSNNYDQAPGGLRTMMWLSVVVIVGTPYGYEFVQKRRHKKAQAGDEAIPEPEELDAESARSFDEAMDAADDQPGDDLPPRSGP